MTLENARFEWVDGVLVQAVEQGKWLVLDNSNLCSASVLDRLNSLLEPNGFLSINEHCGPDGEPKVVRPHPDFRIFLTMDPRFGELSRAMRNRAVEIFVQPLSTETVQPAVALATRSEATMQRYRNVFQALETSSESPLLQQVALDNLCWSDVTVFSRFSAVLGRSSLAVDYPQLYSTYSQIYNSQPFQNFREAVGELLGTLASKTSLAPATFRDAQVSDRAVPSLGKQCTDSFNKKSDHPPTPKLSFSSLALTVQ
jgi:hypothetical protein